MPYLVTDLSTGEVLGVAHREADIELIAGRGVSWVAEFIPGECINAPPGTFFATEWPTWALGEC